LKAPRQVKIGYIRRAVGLRGEVEVELLTDDKQRFRPGLSVHAGTSVRRVEAVRQGAGTVVLKFTDVNNRDVADDLRGQYLEIKAAEVVPLPEGSYYHWELLGLEVFDLAGARLGEVTDILDNPANDIYVVGQAGGGQMLVPAVAEVVRSIDLEAGRMVVDLPDEEVLVP
jgi:16S rRNA processing protein RimM